MLVSGSHDTAGHFPITSKRLLHFLRLETGSLKCHYNQSRRPLPLHSSLLSIVVVILAISEDSSPLVHIAPVNRSTFVASGSNKDGIVSFLLNASKDKREVSWLARNRLILQEERDRELLYTRTIEALLLSDLGAHDRALKLTRPANNHYRPGQNILQVYIPAHSAVRTVLVHWYLCQPKPFHECPAIVTLTTK